MMGRVYAIDPGLGGTGWAEWADGRRRPTRCGVIPGVRDQGHLASRCNVIAVNLKKIVKKGGGLDASVHVYIEMPQYMASAAGLAAQKSSVYKLTFLVGYLACILWPCEIFEVNPQAWKGQLPKDVVAQRVRQYIGNDACVDLDIKTHAWDAVGLGLWANGVWRG